MRHLKYTFIISLITLPIFGYTLQDVIEASSQVADATPSLLCVPCAGTAITLNDHMYELRLFTFEEKGVAHSDTPTFKQFIADWDMLAATPRQRAESLIPTDYFTATQEMRDKGFHFLLSLREVTDDTLIADLKARQ